MIVPDALTVKERLLVPPGATALDQLSLVAFDVVLGVVGVSLPQPAAANTAITSHEDTKARSDWFGPADMAAFMDAKSELRNSPARATRRRRRGSRSNPLRA